MATLARGVTYGATETITAAKLHSLVDDGSLSGILTADITDAQITNAKINDVSGAKFTNLSSVPAGSGVIPKENLTSVAQKGANSDITSLTGLTTLLSRPQGGLASSVANNAASGVVFLDANSKLPAVDGSQLTNVNAVRHTLITTTGASHFTTGAGITKVYLTMCGGGAGGGAKYNDTGSSGAKDAGGGGGGGGLIKYPYTVSASTEYDVTVGAGGTEGVGGGNTTFDTLTVNGGTTGTQAGSTGVGGAGGNSPEARSASTTTTGKPYFAGGTGGTGDVGASGAGGASIFGIGGASGGGAGNGLGAGGGGGTYQAWSGAVAGGTGGQGFILVEW